jgi:23S rRNA pseudouridine1911/1915/1917 synthase
MTDDREHVSPELIRQVVEVIPQSLTGIRIDRVVSLIADVSRSAAAALIDGGAVALDEHVVTAGKEKVSHGQTIRIDLSRVPPPELPRADASLALDIVHEDADVIVVNKPAGLVVHPGAGNKSGTMVNHLLAQFPEIASVGEPTRPGIVHRLDAGTTGLLVVARSELAYHSLVDQLAARTVSRVYAAVVWGIPTSLNGVIDAPIGRDHRDPTRMAVVVDGRPSRTHYAVTKSFHAPKDISLLECRLETGRTHQIRVHLASIGHPVVGDANYGGVRVAVHASRPMLHARELEFDHPRSGERQRFQVPLPTDFAGLLASLTE